MLSMTILIMPTVECNAKCAYCFESGEHERRIPLNLQAIRSTLDKLMAMPTYQGATVGIHGGECLLADISVLEECFKMSEKYASDPKNVYTSIVTNGTLVTKYHIELFKRYNTKVSLSVDGPPELNTLRGPDPDNVKVTERYNNQVKKVMRELRKEGIGTSIMCILHAENVGTPEKVERMKEWIVELQDMGILGGRINPMYTNNPDMKQYELTSEQLGYAYVEFAKLTFGDWRLRWLPFREFVDNILGFSCSPCAFDGCDYLHTLTTVILPDGSVANCDRTFADGPSLMGEGGRRPGRTSALVQDQCKGCLTWDACHGGCPAEGLDGDWRNKTRFCEAYKALYEFTKDYIKGLLPNVRFRYEPGGDEPFRGMSWAYTIRPSTHGNYVLKDPQQLAQTTKVRDPNHNDAHGDEHNNRPHQDHYDEARQR